MSVAIVACVSGTPPTTVVTPSSTATGPVRSATASPLASGFAAEPEAVTGITANALGALQGSWIFFTRSVPIPPAVSARLEVWGIPPGGTPRLAFSYAVQLGGVPEQPLDNSPYLRRQFSPDGRRIVVSTTTAGLVVVDLPSAQARRLGVGGQFPSWSKDGSQIAYLATVGHPDPQVVPQARSIWVVPAAGAAPRELIGIGYSSTSPEWSSDSSALLAQLQDGVGLVDVSSASEIAGSRIPAGLFSTGAHWPAGRPMAAVTLLRRDDTQVVTYDRATGSWSVVAQFPRPFDPSSCQCPRGIVPRDPRWSPAGTDELLYVLQDEVTGRREVNILDTRSGRLEKLSLDAWDATWSADGTAVVYVARRQGSLQGVGGGALRIYDRSSASDRELVAAPGDALQLSVALVIY